MTQEDFREAAWQSCTKRIVAMIEEYSASWVPGGVSKATAVAIVNKIRVMPTPQTGNGPQ